MTSESKTAMRLFCCHSLEVSRTVDEEATLPPVDTSGCFLWAAAPGTLSSWFLGLSQHGSLCQKRDAELRLWAKLSNHGGFLRSQRDSSYTGRNTEDMEVSFYSHVNQQHH